MSVVTILNKIILIRMKIEYGNYTIPNFTFNQCACNTFFLQDMYLILSYYILQHCWHIRNAIILKKSFLLWSTCGLPPQNNQPYEEKLKFMDGTAESAVGTVCPWSIQIDSLVAPNQLWLWKTGILLQDFLEFCKQLFIQHEHEHINVFSCRQTEVKMKIKVESSI